jgi:hypothetical protein
MKKKIILGSFLALTYFANAQWSGGATETTPGNVGIGTTTPASKLHVVTTNNLDGIRASTGPAQTQGNVSLALQNNTTGGNTWRLYSLGVNDGPGAGNFVIADNAANRIFINGSTGNVGIGATNAQTQNRLVINKGLANQSGLRFINLTSISPTSANPGTGVLSVDANGDVIYVPASSGSGLGNLCSGTSNPITGNYQIPLNNFNFNFTNPANSLSQVRIGQTTCGTSSVRLDVFDDRHGTGIRGYSSTSSLNNIGVHGMGFDPATASGIVNIGVLGETNVRVPANKAAGVAGFCGGSPNYALMPTGQDIGVYGNSLSNFGAWAGYFDGNVNINGQAFCTASAWSSDKRFKNNIKGIDNVAEKLERISGYTYQYKSDEFKTKNFPKGNQIGFLAQELKEVFPELVIEDREGYLAVNYVGMIPVLLEAIKGQQKQLNEQKQLIDQLLASKSAMPTGINEIEGASGFKMEQNIPNPFSSETVVKYTLTEQTKVASLVVYDLSGKQITSFPIEKNSSSITITSEKLAAGIYIYSIIADGKIVDSKRMVVSQK